jgi:LysR family transcriptional regulator, glycine cleavage system transcriptional activator
MARVLAAVKPVYESPIAAKSETVAAHRSVPSASAAPAAGTSRKLLPPTQLLRAFVCTARHGSVAVAAEELHVTPGAVSKQLGELERWVGIALFERLKKRLHLTPAGQRYQAQIEPLLKQIEAATLELLGGAAPTGALVLSTMPTFGAKWLFPRLPAFRALYPQIELRFMPYVKGYDFDDPALDCAIRYGEGPWPGACADYIVGHETTVIAPPRLPEALALNTPADVARHTLLRHVTTPQAWADWCRQHQVEGVNAFAGPELDMVSNLVSAVQAGLGLALVPRCLVVDEIASGSVSEPFAERTWRRTGYSLCYPQAKASMPALQCFRQWLLAEAPEEARRPAS